MSWQDLFSHLADDLGDDLGSDEGFTLVLDAENSSFVRFNHGKIRQPGDVRQGAVTLRWILGRRHASARLSLSGLAESDRATLRAARDRLRGIVQELPEDPHLLLNTHPRSTRSIDEADLPPPERITAQICQAAEGLDLVGILATGTLHRAFANHLGQRNAFSSAAALFDWSLVAGGDKAVKLSYGGTHFSFDELRGRMAKGLEQLAALQREPHTIPPGRYRAYLAPAAVEELLGLLSWDAFSCRAQRAGSSPLGRLVAGKEHLDPRVHLLEDTAGGIGPDVQGDGFLKPDAVPLITNGRHAGCLISPRSAAEYGLEHNGADARESPASLSMAGGELDAEQALQALGTGVWISNLWYLNHSDRNAGRITGMTRFATFWVQEGQIVAPLSVMRFEDRIYDLLGEALEGITRQRDLIPSASTYEARSTDSVRVPGLLLRGLTFTL
ncbi:MAG: TldE/PmbA family protein [Deltaproteobacteria bacterium]|nr:MAG: TldE/PmbA family protein [Deltaproteobacteria bacterium]